MKPVIVGVISDTHGLLRAEAVSALAGSHLIIHAGDIGSPEIIPALRQIAPVTAIRGNVDRDHWALEFAETTVAEVADRLFYVLHDRKQLDLKPAAAGFAAVISGHSHRPAREVRDGVLYFNPGSAGPRRFSLPVSLGRITVTASALKPEIILL